MCLRADYSYTLNAYLCCHGLGESYNNPFGYELNRSQICMSSYLSRLTVCRVAKPERPKALVTCLRQLYSRLLLGDLPQLPLRYPSGKASHSAHSKHHLSSESGTTLQASSMTRATSGAICGQLILLIEHSRRQRTTCYACSTSVISM